jgi:mannitol/fructose-specific phosphotransferase system IIA component (Ntr-type)
MPVEIPTRVPAVLNLTDYTRYSLIVPRLKHSDAAGIISELSQVLHQEGCMPEVLPFYHAALNQELLANSALQCGIAFPHARLSGVRNLQFAFGRTPERVPWGARGSWPVEFVFLLAVPATDAASYLHLLASLARLGQQPHHLEELRVAADAEEILRVLGKITIRQG